jgi:DNA-binding NarL/FixJ family response regulator
MSARVAIVEDDAGVRESLAALIGHSANFRLVAECASGEQALVAIPECGAEIAVMDIHLPGMQGIDCIARLKARLPRLQVLVLTSYEDADTIFRALKAGAGGYLVKRDASAMLLGALTEIMAGGAPMSCQIARKVVHFFHQRAPAAESVKLSAREVQILDLLVAGCILKEVADQLGIGRETVRTHVRHIYEKLQARSAAEAVAKYLRG